MKIKSLLVILLLISLMVSVHEVTAGGKRVGSAAGIELIIPMGAQNVGIGGSNVANVNGMEAMYWNPAGLSQVRGVQAGFNYMTYFADMKISYFAVATNVGKLGVVGFFFRPWISVILLLRLSNHRMEQERYSHPLL